MNTSQRQYSEVVMPSCFRERHKPGGPCGEETRVVSRTATTSWVAGMIQPPEGVPVH
jgi:hypothetical protein